MSRRMTGDYQRPRLIVMLYDLHNFKIIPTRPYDQVIIMCDFCMMYIYYINIKCMKHIRDIYDISDDGITCTYDINMSYKRRI